MGSSSPSLFMCSQRLVLYEILIHFFLLSVGTMKVDRQGLRRLILTVCINPYAS